MLQVLHAPGLWRAAATFGAIAFGAWGMGDLIVSLCWLARPDDSRFLRPSLALSLGCGLLGETLFVAGALGNAYQVRFVGTLLAVFCAVGVSRLRGLRLDRWTRAPPSIGVYGWVVVCLTAAYLTVWAWVSLGFNSGSDVFSHHYIDVKYMLRVQHFAYALHLPSAHAHVSSYNPALARMLWLPGHLLADERAANMFHWLTQVMLVLALYLVGRTLNSARAGLFAVGLYLTTGMLGYYPLEAQDYTIMAVFMLLAMLLMIRGLREGSLRPVALAGACAGCMLAAKYYAIPIAGIMVAAILLWEPRTWLRRVRSALLFAAMAGALYAPWLLYNWIVFHDPLFPSSLQNDEMRLFQASYWVQALSPFVVSSDHGFLWPTVFYYLSLFIPIDPGSAPFDLSVVFLIALPCSVYFLLRARGPHWRVVHLLFVVAVVSFVALHVLVGHTAFYKWAFFPAVLYACSFGLLVTRLRPRAAHAFWLLTLSAIGLNYWFISAPRVAMFLPTVIAQRLQWTDMARYLNALLEPNAIVTGTSSRTAYYLRPDLTGMWEDGMASTDWSAEQAVIQRIGVTYVIVTPADEASYDRAYQTEIAILRQLSPDDSTTADYIADVQRRHHQRNRDRADFLALHATLVPGAPDGGQLYRLR